MVEKAYLLLVDREAFELREKRQYYEKHDGDDDVVLLVSQVVADFVDVALRAGCVVIQ